MTGSAGVGAGGWREFAFAPAASDPTRLHVWVDEAGEPSAPLLVMLHAGGPDHHSLVPLAKRLAGHGRAVLPDLRGYGASVCGDPAAHTWARYTEDLIALLDQLDVESAVLVGAGLGSTITLRAAADYPDRVVGAVLIGVEDIEDDQAKAAEIEFMDAFAERVAAEGIRAGWEPILAQFPPVVGAMVRDAITRSDPASIVAAAAIGRDRSFTTVEELAVITAPVLIFPGTDPRHPTALAQRVAATVAHGRMGTVAISGDLHTAEELAAAIAPDIARFLTGLHGR